MQIKILILIFALIGFFLSIYLYLYSQNASFCIAGGCNNVLNSKFSKTLGINNSLLGIFYFLVAGILAYFNQEKILKFISIFGAIFAVYLIFIMLFILKEICYYCLIVDFTSVIIFIILFFIKLK
jgi:uncharacterized membrane protein